MHKILFSIGFSLFLFMNAFAQSEATVVYIEMYKKIAVDEMKRTGIPASITLAQGILESNSGESSLAKKSNNHFGIKCKSDWKGETVFQDDDSKNECFRVYPTVLDSYKDHSNFLKSRPNYAGLFQLDPVDDSAWAYGLKKAGYATASDYPKKLLKVINDYELSQYNFPELEAEDSIAADKSMQSKPDSIIKKDSLQVPFNQLQKDSSKQFTDTVSLSNVPGIMDAPAFNSIPLQPNSLETNLNKDSVLVRADSTLIKSTGLLKDTIIQIKKDTVAPLKKINSITYPKVRFRINDVPVVWATAGSSYLAIAAANNVALYKLFEYNEISENDMVLEDQLVFLAAKKKTNPKKIHIVKEGETLYSISQTEGMQYNYLQSYNILLISDKLKAGATVLLFNPK